VQLDEDESWL